MCQLSSDVIGQKLGGPALSCLRTANRVDCNPGIGTTCVFFSEVLSFSVTCLRGQ